MRATVVNADLVGYSKIVGKLHEIAPSSKAVAELNQQIEEFFVNALNELHLPRESLFKTMGDGGILLFQKAKDAFRFASELQAASAAYSADRIGLGERLFRVGIATGEVEVVESAGSRDVAGYPVVLASRLQDKAEALGALVDSDTYKELLPAQRDLCESAQRVLGKRDEEFIGYPCRFALSQARSAAVSPRNREESAQTVRSDDFASDQVALPMGNSSTVTGHVLAVQWSPDGERHWSEIRTARLTRQQRWEKWKSLRNDCELRWISEELRRPKINEVLIKVDFAGVNRADLLQVRVTDHRDHRFRHRDHPFRERDHGAFRERDH